MPGTLGIMPILPPPKGGGGKAKFPMPLDHPSSGLHVTGSVNAEQRPVRGGVTAYRPPPRGIPRAAPIRAPQGLRVARNPLIGQIGQEQRSQRVREGNEGRARGLLRQIGQEQRQQRLGEGNAGRRGGGGGLSLATIAALPGLAVSKGYENLASATGVSALKTLGKIPAEAINIPTQAPVAAYYGGKALGQARQGHPEELEKLAHQFTQESAVAHLFKGDIKGAVTKAGEHPLNTALEVGGAAGALDRTLGAIGRSTGLVDKAVAEGANISRGPRPLPQGMAPEGIGVQQKPFNKGLIRGGLERKADQKAVSGPASERALRKAFDQHEAEVLLSTRQDRAAIDQTYHKALKIKGREAVGHFASGLLADPSKLAKDGTPLYRHQLGEAIDHFSRTPPEELPQHAQFRNEVVAHLKDLAAQPHEHFTQAYKTASDIAAKKRAMEPELQKHKMYTGDTMRVAKMIKAFQFHFRDQNPFVDTTYKPGESPFKLGGPEGRSVSVDEVAKKLEAKGVHEDQLSFVSTRPFQTEAQARVSGYKAGGRRENTGHLTGAAYMRGHFDPSPEALTRQHLTTQNAINAARATIERSRRFYLKNTDLAKMVEDHLTKRTDLPPEQRAALARSARELRFDNNTFFHDHAGRSAGQRALEAQQMLREIGITREPVRVAHPYATAAYRQGLAEHLLDHADLQDRLEPPQGEPHHMPSATIDEARSAGPVALVHPVVRNRMAQYEANLGKAHLGMMPGSFWRKANVAYSPRHPAGVTQELGIRALVNNIGALSLMRGTKAREFLKDYATSHPDPEVKHGWQRIEAHAGGTGAGYALSQGKHTTIGQLERTWLGRPRSVLRGKNAQTGERTTLSPLDWWLKGETHKLTGLPLRAVRSVVKGTNKTTEAILRAQRKAIEHPPQVAGLGKHYAQEYKTLTGKTLPLLRSYNDMEKAFLRGQLNPKAIDHFANQAVEYWGQWKNASPSVRKAQAVSPFFRWYANALKFVYWTMPKDHPIQSGLIAAVESASREQRLAEGQEYGPNLELGKGKLPAYQQGSEPNFFPGFLSGGLEGKARTGQEYYLPAGAVSQGPVETALNATLPYATGLYNTMQGIDPITHRPIEEVNPETKRKEPIGPGSKAALLGAIAGLESFVPPLRWATQAEKGKSPQYIFRPFRVEKEAKKVGERKARKGSLGVSLGGGLGGKLGGNP